MKRVLLVDDHDQWRRHVADLLETNPGWRIVGEACDGLDALQQIETGCPDLVLLDVGLPKLNGIEVARRLRRLAPSCRILFLTEQSTWDIVDAALGAGGDGYVLKSEAGRELLPAMEAVAGGGQFVGTRLEPRAAGLHEAGFYSDDALLLDDFGQFAESRLKAGRILICVSAAARRHQLEQALGERGLDIDRLVREARYLWFDLADALSTLLVDGWPDETRLEAFLVPLLRVDKPAAERPRLAAWGECAPELWRSGKVDAALRLEQLWDAAARVHGIDVMCAYARHGSPSNDRRAAHDAICSAHSSVHTR